MTAIQFETSNALFEQIERHRGDAPGHLLYCAGAPERAAETAQRFIRRLKLMREVYRLACETSEN